MFDAEVAGVPGLRRPSLDPADLSTIKDLTILIDPLEFGLDAGRLARALAAEGVDTRRYFHPPVHRQRAYRSLRTGAELPVTGPGRRPGAHVAPVAAHVSGADASARQTVIRLQRWAAELRTAGT